MKTSPLNSLLVLAIWPTTVVVQAFASSSSHKTSLLSPPKSFLQKHHHEQLLQNHHNNQLHTKTTTTSLNLFGGSAAAAAVTKLIPRGGGGGITSNLATLASTPNGSFNLALGVLAASTAVLKISNKADKDGGGGDAVVKKDPKVASLQRRFLMVFWLLRMADWLQVSTSYHHDV